MKTAPCGTVADQTGAPLAGVEITAIASDGATGLGRAISDRAGEFALAVRAPRVRLRATAFGLVVAGWTIEGPGRVKVKMAIDAAPAEVVIRDKTAPPPRDPDAFPSPAQQARDLFTSGRRAWYWPRSICTQGDPPIPVLRVFGLFPGQYLDEKGREGVDPYPNGLVLPVDADIGKLGFVGPCRPPAGDAAATRTKPRSPGPPATPPGKSPR